MDLQCGVVSHYFLSFVAGTLAFLINPHLADNKTYMIIVILITFWAATLLNCFGMRLSSWVSTIGALIGTLLPMAFIIILGIIWYTNGHHSQISFTAKDFWPDLSSINNLSFLTAVLFGLVGMEMSALMPMKHTIRVKTIHAPCGIPAQLFYSV